MKNLSILLVAVVTMLAVMTTGCSKSPNGDAESLLQTVPADAGMVAVVNIQNITEALGCNNDGSQITLTDDIKKAVAGDGISADDRETINAITSGEAGVATNAIVYFSAARDYVTGLLNNPDQFIAYMQKHYGNDGQPAVVQEEDGVKIIGKAAVIGNQFWLSSPGRPDAAQLKYYQKLSGKQSYASSKAAERLLAEKEAVSFVSDMNGPSGLMGGGNRTQIRMATSLLFDNATYLAGGVTVEKKDVSLNSMVLNSDFKPAKFLLPTDDIDTSVIKEMAGGGDIFFAAGISKKFIEKLLDLAKGFMGGLPADYTSSIGQIDGTVAMRADANMNDMQLKVQTDGKDFATLSSVLQSMGYSATRDGNTVSVVQGTDQFSGSIAPDKAASLLKGAWMGAVVANYPEQGNMVVVKLESAKSGLEINATVEGGTVSLLDYFLK